MGHLRAPPVWGTMPSISIDNLKDIADMIASAKQYQVSSRYPGDHTNRTVCEPSARRFRANDDRQPASWGIQKYETDTIGLNETFLRTAGAQGAQPKLLNTFADQQVATAAWENPTPPLLPFSGR